MRSALAPITALILSTACGFTPDCGPDLRYEPSMRRCVCDHEWDPEAGVCFEPDAGTDACIPSAEICNGLDDDCDGDTDEVAAATSCVPGTDVATATCSAGSCAVTACRPGVGDCDRDFDNGCEADLTSDGAHCGSCAITCSTSQACESSACEPLPIHDWVRTIGAGGGTVDITAAVPAGAAGAVAIAGSFTGTVRIGTAMLTTRGGADAFVAMVTSAGGVSWVEQVGGPGLDGIVALAVDGEGGVFAVGSLLSDLVAGGQTVSAIGGGDAYVLRFGPLGGLQQQRTIGGPGLDRAIALTSSSGGDVYVALSVSGPLTVDGIEMASGAVVGRLRDADATFSWAAGLPTSASLFALAARDDAVFGIGTLEGPAVIAGTSLTPNGENDALFAEWSSSGSLVWAGTNGGPRYDFPLHAVATSDLVFAAGSSYDAEGGASAALWRIDSAHSIRRVDVASQSYVTFSALASDGGVIYVAGALSGELDAGDFTLSSAGGTDVFLTGWNTRMEPVWGTAAGGAGDEWPGAIAFRDGRAVVAGRFGGDARFGGERVSSAGTLDGFLWRTRVR